MKPNPVRAVEADPLVAEAVPEGAGRLAEAEVSAAGGTDAEAPVAGRAEAEAEAEAEAAGAHTRRQRLKKLFFADPGSTRFLPAVV